MSCKIKPHVAKDNNKGYKTILANNNGVSMYTCHFDLVRGIFCVALSSLLLQEINLLQFLCIVKPRQTCTRLGILFSSFSLRHVTTPRNHSLANYLFNERCNPTISLQIVRLDDINNKGRVAMRNSEGLRESRLDHGEETK